MMPHLNVDGPAFAQQDDRFPGVSDYFTFSEVYFNQTGTLALTALSSWCGGLCAQSQWRVFEKHDGKWQELRWGLCATIALNLGLSPETPVTPAGRPAAD